MTYDDGIVKIYRLENGAKKGDKPIEKAVYKSSYHFSYEDVGLTRYYSALSAKQQIECVIGIYLDRSILTNDIAVMEDGNQYRIQFVQHPMDEEDEMRYTRLTLERINDRYVIE